MKTIDKVLIKLNVLQERDNPNRLFSIYEPKEYRFNPYNPLSYIVWVTSLTTLYLYEIFKLLKGSTIRNPFKWD